jgi:hypothetical protein
MHPDPPDSNWRYRGSLGQFTGYYVELGRHLVASGLENTIIRLGWEMNISDIGPTATEWQQWNQYWRKIVVGMRSVPGQAFRFDWDPNQANGPDFSEFYPGDERWSYMLTEPNGLLAQQSFASAHGKQMSYPEWGLVSQAYHCGGGDDPYYIDQMANWFNTNSVAYQSYFDIEGSAGDSRLSSYPRAQAEFKARFG